MNVPHRAKRDAAEPAIVDALEAAGAWVWRIDLPLDLLVAYHQRSNRGKPYKRQAAQTETIARCQRDGLPVYVIRSPEEALHAIPKLGYRAAITRGGRKAESRSQAGRLNIRSLVVEYSTGAIR